MHQSDLAMAIQSHSPSLTTSLYLSITWCIAPGEHSHSYSVLSQFSISGTLNNFTAAACHVYQSSTHHQVGDAPRNSIVVTALLYYTWYQLSWFGFLRKGDSLRCRRSFEGCALKINSQRGDSKIGTKEGV